MSRAVIGSDLTVVFGTLILFAYQNVNRGSGFLSLKNTGEDLNRIILFSRSRVTTLSRFPAV